MSSDERNVYQFFFSSRRRHTRSLRDWSSDVCSSDLEGLSAASAATSGRPSTLAGLGFELARLVGPDTAAPAVQAGRARFAPDSARRTNRPDGAPHAYTEASKPAKQAAQDTTAPPDRRVPR